MAKSPAKKAAPKAAEPHTTTSAVESVETRPSSEAPLVESRPKAEPPSTRKATKNGPLFADLLQGRMLDQENARLRDTQPFEAAIVYEFTNGERVTAERSRLDAMSADDLPAYVAEVFKARQRP